MLIVTEPSSSPSSEAKGTFDASPAGPTAARLISWTAGRRFGANAFTLLYTGDKSVILGPGTHDSKFKSTSVYTRGKCGRRRQVVWCAGKHLGRNIWNVQETNGIKGEMTQ